MNSSSIKDIQSQIQNLKKQKESERLKKDDLFEASFSLIENFKRSKTEIEKKFDENGPIEKKDYKIEAYKDIEKEETKIPVSNTQSDEKRKYSNQSFSSKSQTVSQKKTFLVDGKDKTDNNIEISISEKRKAEKKNKIYDLLSCPNTLNTINNNENHDLQSMIENKSYNKNTSYTFTSLNNDHKDKNKNNFEKNKKDFVINQPAILSKSALRIRNHITTLINTFDFGNNTQNMKKNQKDNSIDLYDKVNNTNKSILKRKIEEKEIKNQNQKSSLFENSYYSIGNQISSSKFQLNTISRTYKNNFSIEKKDKINEEADLFQASFSKFSSSASTLNDKRFDELYDEVKVLNTKLKLVSNDDFKKLSINLKEQLILLSKTITKIIN